MYKTNETHNTLTQTKKKKKKKKQACVRAYNGIATQGRQGQFKYFCNTSLACDGMHILCYYSTYAQKFFKVYQCYFLHVNG